MKITLVGFSFVDISVEKSKNNRAFSGTTLYAFEELPSGFNGKGKRPVGRWVKGACFPICVPSNILPQSEFEVGSSYEISFNMAGYVDSCTKVR